MPKKNKAAPIPQIEGAAVDDKPLRFSFKHLDIANEKFDLAKCGAAYFHQLLRILQTFSTWTVGQFVEQNNLQHRHMIVFEETSEPNGFQNIPQLDKDQFGYAEGWQFSVYPELAWYDWRAHGILVDDTFYIVWLDPDHNLYPKRPRLGQ